MEKPGLIRLLSLALLWLAVLGLLPASEARADSWPPPEKMVTLSANGEFRFTAEPAAMLGPGDEFRQDFEPTPDGTPVKRPPPTGLLEKRGSPGEWVRVWSGPLVNRIAPTEALVANDGSYVVTFDNWYSYGHGEHVIVLYGPDGTMVRSLALTDLVHRDYVEALPHSVSSLHWREEPRLSADGASVIIPVVVPSVQRLEVQGEAQTVAFTIALVDGAVTLPSAAQWESALAATAKVTAAMVAAEAKWLAERKAPLTPPQGCEEQDWHEYLREAHARLSAEPPYEVSTSTTVLFPRDHPRHCQTFKWLRDEGTEVLDFPTNAAFASPCDADALLAAFAKAAKRVKRGAAVNATFYIAAPEPQFAAIARLVAPTGAKTVWIDLATPIPQRPERIPGSPEEKAARDAEMDRISEELAQEMP
jgi:hypothetical protein